MIKKITKIPDSVSEAFSAIRIQINHFCEKHLNHEYNLLLVKALSCLARKRPSPITKGKTNIWACSIIYSIGQNNFLFDKDQQLYIPSKALREWFECSESTVIAKSKIIKSALKISPIDSSWLLPNQITENPMVWMVKVNGIIVDIRKMPKELQQIAFEKGIIPYLPNE